jgi:hypothetical protein
VTVELTHADEGVPAGKRVVFSRESGQLAFAADDGTPDTRRVSIVLHLTPMDRQTARFYIAWHYPKLDSHQRYYTRHFKDASAVLDRAAVEASS